MTRSALQNNPADGQSPLEGITNWPQLSAAAGLLLDHIKSFDVEATDEESLELLQRQITAWQSLIEHSEQLIATTNVEEHRDNLQMLSALNTELIRLTEKWRETLSSKLSGQLKTRTALNAYTNP